ncbi:hypothetical protein [Olsenella sp. DNF00959]|uniref:hypothetical protein n=1 Tax=Olsenella sp. DNF00959 TaxID=1476999 RepID=UPI0007824797|nr:hypothetical protein [Olsenella sp. DNF00959]KXB63846.1 hypothetical protein HMPREF1868_00360 [Olsenella sp. DNF00959]
MEDDKRLVLWTAEDDAAMAAWMVGEQVSDVLDGLACDVAGALVSDRRLELLRGAARLGYEQGLSEAAGALRQVAEALEHDPLGLTLRGVAVAASTFGLVPHVTFERE